MKDTDKDEKPRVPSAAERYVRSGYPSLEELAREQGTKPITDPSVLHGDFWPEEETMEEIIETLREWRGHRRRDDAA